MSKPPRVRKGRQAWKSWGESFRSALKRGYDHGYAAFLADSWERRKNKQTTPPL